MLHWLLPPSPPAINGGVQLSLWTAPSLGDTLKCTRTCGHMENINIITKSKEQVRTAATRPWVIQSEHPPTHFPQGDWIRGLCGAATLLGPADNWVINVKPLARVREHRASSKRPRQPHEAVGTSGQWRAHEVWAPCRRWRSPLVYLLLKSNTKALFNPPKMAKSI